LRDAQFHIVGSSPAAEVQGLAALPGVFVTGRVPDVRPYLAHATAGVAPMRIARGIQNKVLESMAMARPTIVTQHALTGIAAIVGQEVLLADTAEDFARVCLNVAAYGVANVGLAARARVVSSFIWAEKLRDFDVLLELPDTRSVAI
jgi:glycosyltransferase involved in cell wall biosynthesis